MSTLRDTAYGMCQGTAPVIPNISSFASRAEADTFTVSAPFFSAALPTSHLDSVKVERISGSDWLTPVAPTPPPARSLPLRSERAGRQQSSDWITAIGTAPPLPCVGQQRLAPARRRASSAHWWTGTGTSPSPLRPLSASAKPRRLATLAGSETPSLGKPRNLAPGLSGGPWRPRGAGGALERAFSPAYARPPPRCSQPFRQGPPTPRLIPRGGAGGRARFSFSPESPGTSLDRVLPNLERRRASVSSLAGQDDSKRICTAVLPQASAVLWRLQDSLTWPGEYRIPHAGGGLPVTERGCGGGGTLKGREGVLFPLLSGPQEGRWDKTDSGPASSQRCDSQEAFPHAHCPSSDGEHQAWGLDDLCGPHGCLFPCSHCSGAQEIPPLCGAGEVLRVLPPSLRLLPSPSHLLQMRGSSSGTIAPSRSEDSDLHRRLAHPGPLPSSGQESYGDGVGAHLSPGLCYQPGQEPSPAVSAAVLSGSPSGHQSHEGFTVAGETSYPFGDGPGGPAQPSGLSLPDSIPVRDDGSSSPSGKAGPAAYEESPAVVLTPQEVVEAGADPPVGPERHCFLDGPISPSRGHADGPCGPVCGGVHGRFLNRVGWCPGPTLDGRCLVLTPEAHQPSGIGGCAEGPLALCPPVREAARDGPDGQHHCGGLPEQARGDQVLCPSQSGEGDPLMGGHPPELPEGPAHPWGTQRRGRQDVQGWRSAGRVEPRSGSRGRGMVPTGAPSGRPFRQCRERTVPTLVLAQVRRQTSSRGGRHGTSPMAARAAIRVSAPPASRLPTPQGREGGQADPSGGSRQPGGQVVPGLSSYGHVGPMAPSGPAQHPGAGRGSLTVTTGSGAPASGLEAERGKLLHLGLTPAVVATIQGGRAASTTKAYQTRWQLFSNWCSSKELDPYTCPIQAILAFLQELLDKGRAASTLGVFAAAITTGHVGFGNVTARSHPLVKRFLRGARRIRPPLHQVVAPWDLQVVLEGLSRAPFEPIQGADLEHLSYKTAILLALASAKRSGELCALSIHSTCMSLPAEGGFLELRPNPAFQPKVITSSFRSRVIRVRPFSSPPHASVEEERLHCLCPVRAVRCYVERTAGFRRSDQLFVCFGNRNRGLPLSSQRLAHWVCLAIRLAYEAGGLPPPTLIRAHSTRGMATSTALFHGAPVEDICRAASWSSSSTFVQSYLLDVASSFATSVLGGAPVP